MKTKIILTIILIAVYLFTPEITKAQTPTYGITHTLNLEVIGTQDYVARDYIKLLPAFKYKPIDGSTFNARINDNIIINDGEVEPSPFELTPGSIVGSVGGQASVSSSGGATYSIPIEIAPGSNNFVPQISIEYNSQSGNGFLGWGWQISGLSSITRVPKTIYHNGYSDGVKYDDTDDFAIDGNRIVSIVGVYHTENETFSDISKIGDDWTVITKEGLTYTYEYKMKAAGGSKIIQWFVTRIEDSNNNYLLFKYNPIQSGLSADLDGFTQSAYIESIEYTGNGGTSPGNKIEFVYAQRPDVSHVYVDDDEKFKQEKRLYKIKIFSNNIMFREYKFSYSYNNSYSKLKEISLKGTDGSTIKSTIIDWNGLEPSEKVSTNQTGDIDHTYLYTAGDFNGDGISDYIRYNNNNSCEMFLNSGNGSFIGQGNVSISVFGSLDINSDYYSKINSFGDINADGFDDIIMILNTGATKTIKAFISSGGIVSLSFGTDVLLTPSSNNEFEVGDFNADGLTDLMIYDKYSDKPYYRNIRFYYYKKSIPGFELQDIAYTAPYPISCNYIKCMDYNGNGLTDVFYYEPGGNEVNKFWIWEIDKDLNYVQIGSLRSWPNSYAGSSAFALFTSDFNGDGKTDVITASPNWGLYYSTGSSYSYVYSEIAFNENSVIADFNNDGKTDILSFDLIFGNGENSKYGNFVIQYGTGNVAPPLFRTKTFIYNMDLGAGTDLSSLLLNPEFALSFPFFNHFHQNTDKIYTIKNLNYMLADFDGDGRTDFFNANTNGALAYLTFNSFSKDLFVNKITNGYNHNVEFSYDVLTNTNLYNKTSSSVYPLKTLVPALYVVDKMKEDNGTGTQNETNYSYKDLIINLHGKGFMGFKEVTASGVNSIITSYFDIVNNSQYCSSSLKEIDINTATSADISNKSFTYGRVVNGRSIFQYVDNITEDHFENGTINYNYDYDAIGNLTNEETNYSDNDAIQNVYSNFTAAGTILATKPQTVTTTKTIGGNSFSVVTTNTFDATTGNLSSKSANGVTTTFQYDDFGNIEETKVSGASSDIISKTDFDPSGRFPETKTDPLERTTVFSYDNPFGLPTTITDINNLVTTMQYDGFGRLKSKTLPDGQTVTYIIAYAENEITNSIYSTKEELVRFPIIIKYYDNLNRKIGEKTQGFNCVELSSLTTYNLNGTVGSVEDFNGVTTTYSYDDFGRVITISNPEKNITVDNTVPLTTETSIGSSSFSKKVNHFGQPVIVNDNGTIVNYTYYGHGGINTVISDDVAIAPTYNSKGFQETLGDPNAGSISYVYNDLGQLITQTQTQTGGDIVTTNAYDVMGRCTTKTINADVYTYVYDTDFEGALTSVSGPGSMSITYDYNSYGDVLSKTEYLGNAQHEYITSYEYDDNRRLKKKIYNSGAYTLNYSYDICSNLKEIQNENSDIIWSAISMNPSMQVTSYKSGDDITTNNTYEYNYLTSTKTIAGGTTLQFMDFTWNYETGNLKDRADNINNMTEEFTYDGLQRLTNASGGEEINVSYSDNGNIETKTDAGTYTYNSIKKHAVETITDFVPSNFPTGLLTTGYNSLNNISYITEGVNRMDFTYGLASERRKVEMKEDNVLKWTKYYAEDYEIVEYADGSASKEYYYITAPSGLVAVNIKQGSESNLYYTFSDHLGSITTLTDESGNMVEQMSFDAWGRRRNPLDWSYNNLQDPNTLILSRGFTGHEHIDLFGIINMNGRLYDPVVGRFFSPDNYVQGEGLQGFNRYSYCLNNPLKYTDPSGEFLFVPVLIAFGVGALIDWATQTAVNYTQNPNGSFMDNAFRNIDLVDIVISGFASAITVGYGAAFKGGIKALTVFGLPIISAAFDYKPFATQGPKGFSVTKKEDFAVKYIFNVAKTYTAGSMSKAIVEGSMNTWTPALTKLLVRKAIEFPISVTLGSVSKKITNEGGIFPELNPTPPPFPFDPNNPAFQDPNNLPMPPNYYNPNTNNYDENSNTIFNSLILDR